MHRMLSGRRVHSLVVLPALLLSSAVTLAQVRPQPPERANPLRAALMRAHFYQAMLLHDAVARGNLETARLEATRLQAHSTTAPPPAGADAFQAAVGRLAGQAAAAATLPEAARATAAILGACGQCHRALQVRPMPPLGTEIKASGIVGHMLLHQHGSDAFVEGLIAPSDSAWAEGVRTFTEHTLRDDDGPVGLRKQLLAAETALATQAARAAKAQGSRDREEAYGRMLAACGGCHSQVARHAAPDRH